MAKNGENPHAEAKAKQTSRQRRGRPSRKSCIWDNKQREHFRAELRDLYSYLKTNDAEIVAEFAKELFYKIPAKHKPEDESSIKRAINYAIASQRKNRRSLPEPYIKPMIEFLELNKKCVAFLFPWLPKPSTAPDDSRQQAISGATRQIAIKSSLNEQQSGLDTPFSWPSKTLTTREDTPQWADFEEFLLNGGRLRLLKCIIATTSPYFRFGFKLLAPNGKLFGDGSIQSQDMNLLVHIARNNFSRSGISPGDVFLTSYRNGVPERRDKKVFESSKRLRLPVALAVDDAGVVRFFVNDICHYQRAVPLEICHRIVMFGWGDREDFVVKVSDIAFSTTKL